MTASRLHRAGTLLLVVWLTTDLAAIGVCGEELVASAACVTVGAAGNTEGAPSCCTGHTCFCCCSGAEVMTFELSILGQSRFIVPPPDPDTPDISGSDISPPPRS